MKKTKLAENTVRISWLDSTGQPSCVHLTVDGKETICGNHSEHISTRTLIQGPKRKHGFSNFCGVCFKNGGKEVMWDTRCLAK